MDGGHLMNNLSDDDGGRGVFRETGHENVS